ncbi:MAG TPA: hypothetical protein VGA32_00075 [Anaerolineales bacterium]
MVEHVDCRTELAKGWFSMWHPLRTPASGVFFGFGIEPRLRLAALSALGMTECKRVNTPA